MSQSLLPPSPFPPCPPFLLEERRRVSMDVLVARLVDNPPKTKGPDSPQSEEKEGGRITQRARAFL